MQEDEIATPWETMKRYSNFLSLRSNPEHKFSPSNIQVCSHSRRPATLRNIRKSMPTPKESSHAGKCEFQFVVSNF